jgi:hypothetical protein
VDEVIVVMQKMDGKADRLIEDMREVGRRMTAIEISIRNLAAMKASHYAITSGRADRADARLARIEQRLEHHIGR